MQTMLILIGMMLLKSHKKVSDEGREVGIRLDNDILTKGLNQDDVLGVDGDTVIAVNIPPCDVIVAKVAENHHILCLGML